MLIAVDIPPWSTRLRRPKCFRLSFRLQLPYSSTTPVTYVCARYIFALLIAVDIPLWLTRLCRPAAFSLCCSGLICGRAYCLFILSGLNVKLRARLYLRELFLLIAVDIHGSQMSFRFAGGGDLPLWSTQLCRLEEPSLCCVLMINWAGCILLCRYASRLAIFSLGRSRLMCRPVRLIAVNV